MKDLRPTSSRNWMCVGGQWKFPNVRPARLTTWQSSSVASVLAWGSDAEGGVAEAPAGPEADQFGDRGLSDLLQRHVLTQNREGAFRRRVQSVGAPAACAVFAVRRIGGALYVTPASASPQRAGPS